MSGERGGNRTYNLLIKSQLLCQLSYAPSHDAAAGDLRLPYYCTTGPRYKLASATGVCDMKVKESEPVEIDSGQTIGKRAALQVLKASVPESISTGSDSFTFMSHTPATEGAVCRCGVRRFWLSVSQGRNPALTGRAEAAAPCAVGSPPGTPISDWLENQLSVSAQERIRRLAFPAAHYCTAPAFRNWPKIACSSGTDVEMLT